MSKVLALQTDLSENFVCRDGLSYRHMGTTAARTASRLARKERATKTTPCSCQRTETAIPPVEHPKDLYDMKAKFSEIAVNQDVAWSRLSLDGSIHDHALAHAGLDQNL